MSTKDDILSTAIALFNENGTGSVSTNHIATATGISVGNLYYYFDNKEAIIRAIFDVMVADWTTVYESIEGKHLTIGMIEEFVLGHYEMLWKYRFFSRETVALVQRDAVLAEKQFGIYAARMKRLEALILTAEEQGVMNFGGDEELIEDVLTIVMVVSNQFLTHLESVGTVITEETFRRGAALVLQIMYPYVC